MNKKLFILLLCAMSCTATRYSTNNSYQVIDKYSKLHTYNVDAINDFNKANYCTKHYVWEKIYESYTDSGIVYIIRK